MLNIIHLDNNLLWISDFLIFLNKISSILNFYQLKRLFNKNL